MENPYSLSQDMQEYNMLKVQQSNLYIFAIQTYANIKNTAPKKSSLISSFHHHKNNEKMQVIINSPFLSDN